MKKIMTAVFAMMALAVLAVPMQTAEAEAEVKYNIEKVDVYDGRVEASGYFINNTGNRRTVDVLTLMIEFEQNGKNVMTVSADNIPRIKLEAYSEYTPYTVVIEDARIIGLHGEYIWRSKLRVRTSIA